MIRAALIALLLAGCGGSEAPETPETPEPTEPTESLEDRIDGYLSTYGGTEGQYRVILTLTNCDQLDNLLISATESMDHEEQGSEAFRADLGYANAVNSRQLDIDC